MSFASPQEEAGAVAARDSARQNAALANEAFPMLRRVIGAAGDDINIDQTGKIGIPFSVQRQFDQAREGLNSDFDVAGRGAEVYAAQSMRQGGNPYSENQLNDVLLSNARMLEEARSRSMRQLQFDEAKAGMEQYNRLMDIMLGAEGTALNLGGGYGMARNQATAFLPQQSREGGMVAGGMTGASVGSAFGPYGAIAGALIGGGLGWANSG